MNSNEAVIGGDVVAQRPVLGKGLASLLPGAPMSPPASAVESSSPRVGMGSSGAIAAGPAVPVEIANRERIPGITFALIDEIVTNPYQPRREFDDEILKELAQSIRMNGVIQPLVVRKSTYGYQLIAGERRLRASKLAGLKQVPVVVRKSTDREALELALIENIQREDLNCIDESLAYLQLIQDFNLTQEEVSEKVGKERSTVANFLRLLRHPEAIIDDLKRGILSFGHGKALLSLEDQDQRLLIRARVVEQKLSVRATELLVEQIKRGSPPPAAGEKVETSSLSPVQTRLKNLSTELTRHLASRIEIKGNEKRGKISLHYGSREELDRILAFMQK